MSRPRTNPWLLKTPQYVPGKPIAEVKAELGLTEVTKLASNESPIGPSPMAVRAAQAMLLEAHRYPGVMERALRHKIAGALAPGLDERNILVGNGGTDVLRMITQAFVFDGGNTVMSQVTFPMYHAFTTGFGGQARKVEPLPDCRQDLQGILAHIDADTRIVFLCSPNNPTGHIITQAEADRFLAQVPDHVVVVIDESYIDFVTAGDNLDSLAYILAGRNVLSARSFSKSIGLAGLRIGYLVGPAELTDYVRHAQQPFHVSDVALAAAAAGMDDSEFLARHRQAVWAGREYLVAALAELGIDCLASQANFVTIPKTPLPAGDLVAALLRQGFIVRRMGAFGMPDGVRISTGTLAENERLIAALRKALNEATAVNHSGDPRTSREES